jgi:hypothetical protein
MHMRMPAQVTGECCIPALPRGTQGPAYQKAADCDSVRVNTAITAMQGSDVVCLFEHTDIHSMTRTGST